jgi:predicted outer membrane repeat protein
LTVTNCTIAENFASSSGSGIFNSGELTLNNTIVMEEIYRTSGIVQGFNNLTTYTGWSGNFGNNFVYNAAMPLFVVGSYRLAEGSPAINAGSNAYVTTSTDLAGNLRIVGGIVDIGAYEFFFQPIIVTTLFDVVNANDGVISLREAISQAVAGNTIVFDPGLFGSTMSTMTLTLGRLTILKDITIVGPGSSQLTINVANDKTHRVFHVEGSSSKSINIDISGLTISGGKAISEVANNVNGFGGGIYMYATTGVLTDIIVTNCQASHQGGGIYQYFSDVTYNNVVLDSNVSKQYGGGIFLNKTNRSEFNNVTIRNNTAVTGGGVYQFESNNVRFSNGTVQNNTSTLQGGGIYQRGGVLNIIGTRFEGNRSTTNNGGAVFADLAAVANSNNASYVNNYAKNNGGAIYTNNSTLNVSGTSTQFTGNSTTLHGGAIFSYQSTSTIVGATLSNNTSPQGAAVYQWLGQADYNNLNITNNTATGYGGGFFLNATTKAAFVGVNLTGNTAQYGGGVYQFRGTSSTNNTTFDSNKAAQGAGFFQRGGTSQVDNTTFKKNEASSSGGGYFGDTNAKLTSTNTTFTQNTAFYSGAGVRLTSGDFTFKDSLFSGNTSQAGNGITFDNSALHLRQTSPAKSKDHAASALTKYLSEGQDWFL